MTLSRETILGAQDLPTETVDVPEWGGQVTVRTLTGEERDALEARISQARRIGFATAFANFRARMVALACVDDCGGRLFSDADVPALGGKSAAALDRIFAVAQRLAGMSDRDVAELEKNSASGPSVDSISA